MCFGVTSSGFLYLFIIDMSKEITAFIFKGPIRNVGKQ